MATYAHLENGYVINVLVANTLADAELATGGKCVEYTESAPAGVGWPYDEKTNTFIAPVSEPVVLDWEKTDK